VADREGFQTVRVQDEQDWQSLVEDEQCRRMEEQGRRRGATGQGMEE
jgi:hypothetical protein